MAKKALRPSSEVESEMAGMEVDRQHGMGGT
jgi:hypothetical protein